MGKGLLFINDEDLDAHYRRESNSPRPVKTDPNYFNSLMQAYLEGLTGEDLTPDAHTAADQVFWTSEAERYYVTRALRVTSKRLASNAVKAYAENFAFGLYDGFVSATGAGDLYLVVTGRDHFNRYQPTWVRLTAAVGLASNAILSVAGSGVAQKFLARPILRGRLGQAARSETTLIAQGTRSVNRLDGGIEQIGDLPGSLDGAKLKQTFLELSAEPASKGGASCSLMAKRKPPPQTIQNPRQNPSLDLIEYWETEEYIARNYGAETEIIDEFGEKIFDTQSRARPTCNAMSTNYAVHKKTGRRISEAESHEIISNLMWADFLAGNRSVDDLISGAGFAHGYDQRALRHYLRYLCAKVGEVNVASNGRIKLRHIWSALEQGWSVKVVLRFGDQAGIHGYHAVIVGGLVVNPKTRTINAVRVYDPNVGRIIEVPARRFKELIARTDPLNYGVMTVFKFEGAEVAGGGATRMGSRSPSGARRIPASTGPSAPGAPRRPRQPFELTGDRFENLLTGVLREGVDGEHISVPVNHNLEPLPKMERIIQRPFNRSGHGLDLLAIDEHGNLWVIEAKWRQQQFGEIRLGPSVERAGGEAQMSSAWRADAAERLANAPDGPDQLRQLYNLHDVSDQRIREIFLEDMETARPAIVAPESVVDGVLPNSPTFDLRWQDDIYTITFSE